MKCVFNFSPERSASTPAFYWGHTFFILQVDYALVRGNYGATSGMCFWKGITGDLTGQYYAFCLCEDELIQIPYTEGEWKFKGKKKKAYIMRI